jgi:hypothetical protein
MFWRSGGIMAIIIKKREADGYSPQNVYILLSVSNNSLFACDKNGRVFSVLDPQDYEITSLDERTPAEIIRENSGN